MSAMLSFAVWGASFSTSLSSTLVQQNVFSGESPLLFPILPLVLFFPLSTSASQSLLPHFCSPNLPSPLYITFYKIPFCFPILPPSLSFFLSAFLPSPLPLDSQPPLSNIPPQSTLPMPITLYNFPSLFHHFHSLILHFKIFFAFHFSLLLSSTSLPSILFQHYPSTLQYPISLLLYLPIYINFSHFSIPSSLPYFIVFIDALQLSSFLLRFRRHINGLQQILCL